MSRHKTLVGTEVVLILGLVGFVAAMVGFEHAAPGPASLGPLSALAFSAVPSALWLGYFDLQDRNEPEPKQLVGGVFLLGACIAAPLANFVSPMDGIVYMMAAGIGFATAQNYHHLTGLGGTVVLSQAAMNTVINTLAHACFAGVLGYALGWAKLSRTAPVARGGNLFGGLCVAATLNGVFTALEDRVMLAGVNASAAWRGLAWAAGFSAVVFFAVSILMKRQLAASPFRAAAKEAS